MIRAASFSDCGRYRYALWRDWGDLFADARRVCWIMLNPSTADHETDDPTIRRCIGFAKAWGYSGILVVNVFAFRATKPEEMLAAPDPIGLENDDAIREAVSSAGVALTVCAWGANAPAERADRVFEILREEQITPRCIDLTRNGSPCHPLYVRKDAKPRVLMAPAGSVVLERTVRSDLQISGTHLVAKPGTYRAVANHNGAVCAVLPAGNLGLKPGEFRWGQMKGWLSEFWDGDQVRRRR